jgi:hypothetical protein
LSFASVSTSLSPFGWHHLRLAFTAGNHIGFIGFCQVVEAETLSRRASALLQSSLPLRRPAPCPSLRPNSRSGCSSRGGTRMRSADAAEVDRAGPEDRPRRATVAQGREMCTPACDTRVAAAAAARSHPGDGGCDSDGVPRQAASHAGRRRSSAIDPCSAPGGHPASLGAACGSPAARPVGGASLAPGSRGRGRPAHHLPPVMARPVDGQTACSHVPWVPRRRATQPMGVVLARLPPPGTDGCMGHGEATRAQECWHGAGAQREAIVKPDPGADDCAGKAVGLVARRVGRRGSGRGA